MTQIYNPDGGIDSVVEDNTPQLGGDLDLNSSDITGTGNINITGSGTLSGDLTVDTNTLYVDSTNNQVGIGTTTLSEALTVNGNVEANNFIGGLLGEVQFKAQAGEAITKGDPLYISGISGNTPVVNIADADDANKMPAFGLAEDTVSNNASINVVTFGTLSNIDTSLYSLGDILYISTAGTLTATKPSGESSLIQNIGKVQRVHASVGSIKVGGAGRTNDVPNLNNGNVFIGNASNQAETRGLTLDDIAETVDKKIFTATEQTKLSGIEDNATTDQTKADIDALGINADQVDGLEANQFLRSDTGDTIDVGRGNVFIENNSNDNQDGAGITIRAQNNPGSGNEGTVGSIFAVRSSGNATRLWVGQSILSTGDNDLLTNDATINGNITVTGTVDGRDVATDGTKLDGIADNANNYILPIADASTVGGVKSGTDITVDGSGNVAVVDDSHNHVISNIDNLQSSLDGKKDDFTENTAFNKNFGTAAATVAEGNDSRITDSFQKSTDTLDNITAGTTNVHFTSTDNTKLDGIEDNATADQTKADIDALGINADQVDSLEASQFLRSDASDTINVGRGNVNIEDNTNDNQNGAGITIRTLANPASGDEGTAGSIFAVRSSGQATRLWVGQSITSTGMNNFVTNNITLSGDINSASQLNLQNAGNDILTVKSTGVEFPAASQYYFENNQNVANHVNTASISITSTATVFYPEFPNKIIINDDIYEYTQPTTTNNTGFKLLKRGFYKVTYTVNWENVSYTNRVNYRCALVKHSSALTPTETSFSGSQSYCYSRDDSFVKFATNNNTVIIDVDADEYIKVRCRVSKNTTTFGNNFSGIQQSNDGSITIEYLGPMS